MPSFDIVSRTNLAEVDNALQSLGREIATRFDFKDSRARVTREGDLLTVLADDERKLEQMQELLKGHLARRKVDVRACEFRDPEKAAGGTLRQTVAIRQGVDATLARRLIKEIKDSKLKVQVAVQGDELRVSGKKRDELQLVIQRLRGLELEQPLQYVNFRD